MRKIGVCLAIIALSLVIVAPTPAAAFGLRIGPFHIGVPIYLPRFPFHRLYMRANPNEAARSELAQGVTSALLYPNLALPVIFQSVFFPAEASPWPFGYEAIFSTAFAKMPASEDQRLCQSSLDANAIVGRIRGEIAPTADQMQSLQKLGGALGAASGFLAQACPSEIPAQPVARMQLMELQIEELAMAVDVVRQPLQDFEQSLNKQQQAKFATVAAAPAATAAGQDKQSDALAQSCGGSPTAIDATIDQIDQSVQPTAAQQPALADVKAAFGKAASDLQAHCPTAVPPTALGRLESIEFSARCDLAFRIGHPGGIGEFRNQAERRATEKLRRHEFRRALSLHCDPQDVVISPQS